jgi:ABC-type lipoprotein release transport system permease subunit
MGMAKFDSGYILTSLEVARDLVGLEKGAHAIYVMTEDPLRFDEFAEKVKGVLGPAYRVITWQ